MNKLLTIFKKELKRVYSDRKIMFNLFVLPLVSLTLIYSFIGIFLINSMTDTSEHISTIYQENMPVAIIEQLEEIGVNVISVNESDIISIKKNIETGEQDLLLLFDKNFESKISNNEIPIIDSYYNESEEYSEKAYSQFQYIITNYADDILASRIGGHEKLIVYNENPTQLAKENLFIIKMLSGLITMMIVIFIFAGSMQQGIDMIAGEKERGSLATLLMTPTDRKILAAGKVTSLSVIAIASSIVTFLGIIFALLINKTFLEIKSQEFSQGLDETITHIFDSFQFSFDKVLMLLVLMIMTAIISAAFICFLSSRAKNVKEASTLISPFYIVMMIMAYIPYITQETPKFFSYFIPLYSNIAGIYSLIEGTLDIKSFIVCCVMTIIFALIFIYLTGKSFENEKVMF